MPSAARSGRRRVRSWSSAKPRGRARRRRRVRRASRRSPSVQSKWSDRCTSTVDAGDARRSSFPTRPRSQRTLETTLTPAAFERVAWRRREGSERRRCLDDVVGVQLVLDRAFGRSRAGRRRATATTRDEREPDHQRRRGRRRAGGLRSRVLAGELAGHAAERRGRLADDGDASGLTSARASDGDADEERAERPDASSAATAIRSPQSGWRRGRARRRRPRGRRVTAMPTSASARPSREAAGRSLAHRRDRRHARRPERRQDAREQRDGHGAEQRDDDRARREDECRCSAA